MAKIRELDGHTINQIAAGEVVERPSSVVKELLENAIDAGSTQIVIEIGKAGRELIRIADDGCGMSKEDAYLSLLRHATSKIRSAEDLLAVNTLGFRGEALASIASVSKLTMRTAEEEGIRIGLKCEDGRVNDLAPIGGRQGTEIIVEDLFYNTPARLKFLKSDATELGACMDVAGRLAVAHPEVAIRFIHSKFEPFTSPGNGDVFETLASLWGRELVKSLAEIDAEVAGIRLRGFVSPPHITKSSRSYQFFFVNGRPVKSRSLTVALDQAYRDMTPERRFPIVALSLTIDPSKVDINVSPTKSDVRFQHEGAAFEALKIAIRGSLMEHGMIPSAEAIAAANSALSLIHSASTNGGHSAASNIGPFAVTGGISSSQVGLGGELSSGKLNKTAKHGWDRGQEADNGHRFMGSPGKLDFGSFHDTKSLQVEEALALFGSPMEEAANAPALGDFKLGSTPNISIESPNYGDSSMIENAAVPPETNGFQIESNLRTFEASRPQKQPFRELLDDLRVIGQVQNTFIIAETRSGLAIIDQHVAHERVLYEWICGIKSEVTHPCLSHQGDMEGPSLGWCGIEKQPLLTPLTFELDPRAAVMVCEQLHEVARSGFELEPFGGSSFLVRAVPAVLKNKDPLKILGKIVEELAEGAAHRRIPPTCEQVWAMASCKMAVKAGDPLSIAEMQKLIEDLALTENPYLCPHGRPITVTLDGHAILKLFKRL